MKNPTGIYLNITKAQTYHVLAQSILDLNKPNYIYPSNHASIPEEYTEKDLDGRQSTQNVQR